MDLRAHWILGALVSWSDHANFKWKTIAHLFFSCEVLPLYSSFFSSSLSALNLWSRCKKRMAMWYVCMSVWWHRFWSRLSDSVSVDAIFCKCGHYSFQYRLLRALQCVYFIVVVVAVVCYVGGPMFVYLMKDSCNPRPGQFDGNYQKH